MKDNIILYGVFYLVSVFLASVSQIVLKKSAGIKYKRKIDEYINKNVILAYLIFFSCTLFTVIALKKIPLSLAPILESTGYIYIAILSAIFIKEKITKKRLLGISLIIIGVLISVL
ncbi:EamA family transporter [Clostridium beijerinckii]|uniref:EamA family transporter n=1 Tax=Clostridium beijerinckii TaxID=1520 RepID=UPI001361D6DF|nr:EamA family transporter [Clostridium beijerinckii]MZK52790.1 EamA family transporter [Clostridium beijerinckii]MZK60891.1 EamA family transporter [Clostridium beijerinckii]MZK71097.1 EamA family transporter [Clostridium beijerinckii]MZK76455.1 EamA family transporter [Clostridium beijerinckii]MZK85948.1 EamA family transporter [Clostridium beijerinckii]